MVAAGSFKTSITLYQNARCHITEDLTRDTNVASKPEASKATMLVFFASASNTVYRIQSGHTEFAFEKM
jgi:hypothetical protein